MNQEVVDVKIDAVGSYREIAAHFGISVGTLHGAIREYEADRDE